MHCTTCDTKYLVRSSPLICPSFLCLFFSQFHILLCCFACLYILSRISRKRRSFGSFGSSYASLILWETYISLKYVGGKWWGMHFLFQSYVDMHTNNFPNFTFMFTPQKDNQKRFDHHEYEQSIPAKNTPQKYFTDTSFVSTNSPYFSLL